MALQTDNLIIYEQMFDFLIALRIESVIILLQARTETGFRRIMVKRIYVQVDSKRLESGEIIPLTISWEDGRFWNIDRVLHSCVSPDGEFEGIRYTILIGSAEKYIYRVGHSWYVMA